MKSLLLLLLLLLYPLTSFAETDERKIDVYFANGISTNEDNATLNTLLLEKSIKIEFYNGKSVEMSKQIGKVAKSYNSTHDLVISGDGIFDLVESIDQKFNLIKLRDKIAALFGYITSHREDLDKQIKGYEESIRNKHGVLVVAHSQGNLFTKEAYDALSPCMQAQFEAISVASPIAA